MYTWMTRASLELIGQAGLGYSFDPLSRDSKDEYGHALTNLTCVLSNRAIFDLRQLHLRS